MNQTRISEYDYMICEPKMLRLRQCQELETKGPIGRLASMLYRVLNACMLADLHETVAPILGEPQSDHPNITLERMLHETAALLCGSSDYCGVSWGWKRDARCEESPWVMVIILPLGEFQCRVPHRGTGPSYDRGLPLRQSNVQSVSLFCEAVLGGGAQNPTEWRRW